MENMTKIIVLLLTSMALAGLWAGCGGGESKEDIATGVAREWVNTRIAWFPKLP